MAVWKTIFTTTIRHQAELVVAFLNDNGIFAVLLDQMPTTHPLANLGSIKVQVAPEDVILSIKLIKDHINFSADE